MIYLIKHWTHDAIRSIIHQHFFLSIPGDA